MEYKEELFYIEQEYRKIKETGVVDTPFRKDFKKSVVFVDYDKEILPKFNPKKVQNVLTGAIHKKNGELILKVRYIVPDTD